MILKVNYENRGKHTFTRVFMGQKEDHLTICGVLTFQADEFKVYRQVLEDGALLSKGVEVRFQDVSGGSSSRFPKVDLPPE